MRTAAQRLLRISLSPLLLVGPRACSSLLVVRTSAALPQPWLLTRTLMAKPGKRSKSEEGANAAATVSKDEEIAKTMASMKDRLGSVSERLQSKLLSLRSSGADAAILEIINVEVQGGRRVPLKSLGTVAVQSPREMLVQVFDSSLLNDVERAIMGAGLNLVPQADKAKSVIRVPVPKTTKEQREARVKMASELAEAAKADLRRARLDAHKALKALDLPKDAFERAEKLLQKLVDAGNDKLAQMFKQKEKELLA